MAGRLRDKIALVFGAGSSGPGWGNGKATAVSFAREGATVMAVDRVREAAEETRKLIVDEGGKAYAEVADVTSNADIKRVVDSLVGKSGRIDILHNNVGITAMGGPIEESEESWHRIIDTNLTSAFLACKHVLPVMLRQGKGAIVNVSSIAAIRYTGYPYASYYASKAGLNQFTVGLALQYAKQGIRANTIMPGMMDTPLIRTQIAGQYESMQAMIDARNAACPMGRMGTAWEIANAAVFLASDEASYITGVCLPVDGGISCK
jgi:NAD(P)-dependent dehydrogenase (short-subunit alcohol dehydrogenase family)